MSILAEQLLEQVGTSDPADRAELRSLAARAQGKHPNDLATSQALSERHELLSKTVGDRPVVETFERLIAGNELQPINYLAHGSIAARAVCRIRIVDGSGRDRGFATGFLIAPSVLITNNHVFPAADAATRSLAEFDMELDLFDRAKEPVVFALRPDRLFITSVPLDFSVVSLEPVSDSGVELAAYGFLPFFDAVGKAVEGEWLTIIQHPGGERKQLCVRENKFLKRTEDTIWYSTDTTGGSSGSPVFNNFWQVVALHHKGVPEIKNGAVQTIDARAYDPGRDKDTAIKWIANEGIRVSRIIGDLRIQAPRETLLQPVFEMTAERAKSLIDGFAAGALTRAAAMTLHAGTFGPIKTLRTSAMTSRSIALTLNVADDGSVSIRSAGTSAVESFASEAARPAAARSSRPLDYDVPFDSDYTPKGKRKGFDTGFLGQGFEVQLPELGALTEEATKLIGKPGPHGSYVLDYVGYSLVMHSTRKLAIYTAANIDGGGRYALGRPPDQWRYDPRIPRSAQIGDYYYVGNKFDRGHLTRYEDMEYGASVRDALLSAADTLHFTNCAPQHEKFNRLAANWQGLERHVLEKSIEANVFRAQVFTGPVLDEGDPVWERFKDVQYPLRYWKIAVAQTSANKLFAAAFLLDQSDIIAQYGVEATVEIPFTALKTYQVPIAEIERLTGLRFRSGANGQKSLSDVDPLRAGSRIARRAARSRLATTESTDAGSAPIPGYVRLDSSWDIVLDAD